MTYTTLIQILGYLVVLGKGVGIGKRVRFYPNWQETGVFIHIHNTTAKYIKKMLPGGGMADGKWARGEECVHKIKDDGAIVYVSLILGPNHARINMFRRQKPGKKRPYYSLLGVKYEVYAFLSQLIPGSLGK
jgi:hypothetical protein